MTFTHTTAVVNESGYVSTFGGINDGLPIDSEHVTAPNAAFFVTLLSHVSDYLKRKKRDLFLSSLPGMRKGTQGAILEKEKATGKAEVVHLSPV